ncbi:MAG: MBL fold metallo-hydrolase [Paracoccaceae bacterium]|nr:MBL fold metallo-hydrolase [Paracoccaceae bacterium]
MYDHVGPGPIVGMIYLHTHFDHFGGVKGMITDDDVAAGHCPVVASEGFTEWVVERTGPSGQGHARPQ